MRKMNRLVAIGMIVAAGAIAGCNTGTPPAKPGEVKSPSAAPAPTPPPPTAAPAPIPAPTPVPPPPSPEGEKK